MEEKQLDKRHSVLLIEDSGDDFEAVRRAFKKSGGEPVIEHAWTAEEAIEFLRTSPSAKDVGLVLLDLNMPGIGGRKGLEIIKQDENLRKIPVVVLTTSNYQEDIKMCYGLGANTYIQKPLDFDSMVNVIRNVRTYWLETAVLPAVNYPGVRPI